MRVLMRRLFIVACLTTASLFSSVRASQAPPRPTASTLENPQDEIGKLRGELFELRQQLIRKGILSDRSEGPLPVAGRPSAGDNGAPVIIVEFVDFECPFCARHSRTTLQQLRTRYIATKVVQYVIKNLPLEGIHTFALRGAVAAECGHRQSNYWPIHELLFDSPRRVTDVGSIALDIGLERTFFDKCVTDPSITAQVRQDMTEAERLAIQGTPSFVLGKRLADGISMQPQVILSGLQPIERFSAAIDAILSTTVVHDINTAK
jgi:protein-disulfide isomerase